MTGETNPPREGVGKGIQLLTGQRLTCETQGDSSLQQTCKVCGRPDKFDFHVPDSVWEAVIPEEFHTKVVCLYCFDEFAKQKGIAYQDALAEELYFAGKQASFIFNVKSRVETTGCY